MTHWATDYIGLPWVAQEHDCWAFFRKVQREQFGIEVPAFDADALDRMACARAVAGNPERNKWTRVETPQEGDAVLMARAKYPSHVGIWIAADGGGVLHCMQGAGVVFQGLGKLKLSGWGHVVFYRRNV